MLEETIVRYIAAGYAAFAWVIYMGLSIINRKRPIKNIFGYQIAIMCSIVVVAIAFVAIMEIKFGY